ncbi:hypothetical protein CDAR_45331 [Caerostris darwini]|uniref:Uncharacterized protein n=1 Tax=Caerostris darwini TaxID=1538125 RepID=A0AAV4SVQ8_9ARAC|nr:hypothetical protein CDAR_45331 [Caerostris darwini]
MQPGALLPMLRPPSVCRTWLLKWPGSLFKCLGGNGRHVLVIYECSALSIMFNLVNHERIPNPALIFMFKFLRPSISGKGWELAAIYLVLVWFVTPRLLHCLHHFIGGSLHWFGLPL